MLLPTNEPDIGNMENYHDRPDDPDPDPDPDGSDLFTRVDGNGPWNEEDRTGSDNDVENPFQDIETNDNHNSKAEQDLDPDEVTDSDLINILQECYGDEWYEQLSLLRELKIILHDIFET
jgi:hypothetical protein